MATMRHSDGCECVACVEFRENVACLVTLKETFRRIKAEVDAEAAAHRNEIIVCQECGRRMSYFEAEYHKHS